MAHVEDDKNLDDELAVLDDYNVIPRPHELIERDKWSSSAKTSSWTKLDKPSSVSKRLDTKQPSKDKRTSKRERKGSSKGKNLYKSPIDKGSPSKKYLADELENKFESLVQNAKSSISKHKTDKKLASESDVTASKNKFDQDIPQTKPMTEPAITPMQKFQALDSRDAALRDKKSKQGGAKKVKITGTCPDMCPEKERYGRIAKNCLSILEMKTLFDQNATPRDPDHNYMVKEYSRSSADQQEPLPHELRPINVLNFTMDYLICNIMDLPLDNITLADWYDFIWNRTRSIRKDITQQQLCDIQCVEIIEKCVRFHIHCAEALSEEDTATFDPKINNENLTKCLQTLKHMYHDLQSKGIQCPNEAEFRSYDILLSLTEGETLRLIKDIRKDLLKSPLIKSAFEAALAFSSLNYVKFFKIIEKANYLSSCILHRYILEARVRALQIVVRAYTTTNNTTMYGTSNLVKDLKFENAAEACEFCRCHNLEADENFITIARTQFSRTASGLPASRSYLLVESKKGDSLGKIINNGELPRNPLYSYQPHNSFDDRNILKFSDLGSTLNREEKGLGIVSNAGEDMETDEGVEMIQIDSSSNQAIDSRKRISEKVNIKDADIKQLEKARKSLINKLQNLQYLNSEKMKRKKSELVPTSEKTKITKTSTLSFQQPATVTFSAANSEPSKQIADNVKPVESAKPNIFADKLKLSLADFFTSDKAPAQTDTSFFNKPSFSTLSASSEFQFSDYSQDDIASKVKTAVSIPARASAPKAVAFSSPNFESTDFVKNFSFHASSSPPIVYFGNKVPDHIPDSIKESASQSQPTAFDVREFHRIDSPLPSDKSSIQSEEIEIAAKEILDEGIELQEITADDFDRAMSRSSSEETRKELEEITEEERQANELDKFAELVAEDLHSEYLKECLISICEEVLIEEKKRRAELETQLEIIHANLAQKVILKWRLFCERKIQRRKFETSAFLSPWQPMLLNTAYRKTGAMNPFAVYNKNCSLNKLAEEKLKKCKEVVPGWEAFKAEDLWPLNSFKPYPSAYLRNKIKYFFKLCIVVPANGDDFDTKKLINWICAKFSLQRNDHSKFPFINSFTLHDGRALISVAVIQLGSRACFNYSKFLDGISAMILFLPHLTEAKHSFLDDFSHLLESDTLQYSYPLFVYFMKSQETSRHVMPFLQEKLDSGYFTDIKAECLPKVTEFIENSKKVADSLRWLHEIENKDISHPRLHKCSFRHYIEDSFTFAFNILLCKISFDEFKCLKQMPQHLVNFYNAVLEYRASVLCSDLLHKIHLSWPPEEIKEFIGNKFIDMKMQSNCKTKMAHLLLPNFEGDPMSIHHLWKYVESVVPSTFKDKDFFIMKIQNVLKDSTESFDWLHIIHLCALYIIQNLHSEITLSIEDFPVFYVQEDLEAFDSDEFWVDVLSDIRSKSYLKSTKRKNESTPEAPLKKSKWDYNEKDSPCDYPSLVKKNNDILNPFDMPDLLSSQRANLFASVKAALAKQMEQSDAFLHKLNDSVRIGSIPEEKLNETEDFSEEISQSDDNLSLTNRGDSTPYEISPLNSSIQKKTDLFGISLNKTRRPSLSSIADKIAELKYNLEKNNIIEEHFSQLLHKHL